MGGQTSAVHRHAPTGFGRFHKRLAVFGRMAEAEEAAVLPPSEPVPQERVLEFVTELIATADIETISIKSIRKELEEKLGAKAGRDYDKVHPTYSPRLSTRRRRRSATRPARASAACRRRS